MFHGDEDTAITMERPRRCAPASPNCEGVVVVKGAAHAGNLSHPDQVNGPLAEFLHRVA